MFDFLKIFRKKEPEIKTKTVKLSELEDFAKKIENEEMSVVYKKIGRIIDELQENLKELKNASERLKTARFTKDMDPRLEKRVLVARENLADKGIFFSAKILEKKVQKDKWDELLEFQELLKNAFNELNSILLKHAPFIKVGFNKEISAISSLFKKISISISQLEKETGENKEVFEVTSDLTKNSGLFFETWHNIEKFRKELQTKKDEIDELKKSRQILEEKLSAIKNSEKYKELLNAKRRVGEVDSEIASIKTELRNETGVLNKALKKYLYAKGNVLNKNQEGLVEMFSNEPLDCIISGKINELKEILEDMQDMIASREIELDEKTREKIEDSMKDILDIFKDSKEKFEAATKEKNALLEKIEGLSNNDYEETSKTIEVSKNWSKVLEEKIFEITQKEVEAAKILEETKDAIVETLKSRFDIELIIKMD